VGGQKASEGSFFSSEVGAKAAPFGYPLPLAKTPPRFLSEKNQKKIVSQSRFIQQGLGGYST
jgi:hypothetical protein